jgi:Trypsin-like peptidase domain
MAGIRASVMLAVASSLAVAAPGCGRPAAPTQPVAQPQPGAPTASPVAANPKVGAVFQGATELHTCSGSVLHSNSGNLILTAAHCLAGGVNATFAPGFAGNYVPANAWQIEAVYLDPRWLSAIDPLADYAIARVRRDAPGTLESQVGGGLAVGTAPTNGTAVTITGYPRGVGGSPIGCQASTSTGPRGFRSLHCDGLVAGTSGSGWMSGSSVIGLIGGLDGGGCMEHVSYSPPFDGKVTELLARAEQGGVADVPPRDFDDNCS